MQTWKEISQHLVECSSIAERTINALLTTKDSLRCNQFIGSSTRAASAVFAASDIKIFFSLVVIEDDLYTEIKYLKNMPDIPNGILVKTIYEWLDWLQDSNKI